MTNWQTELGLGLGKSGPRPSAAKNIFCAGRSYCAGRAGGVLGYPRAWDRSVSWGQIPLSAYSYKSVGILSCAQIDLRKTRERELATPDEKSKRSGIAEPYAR